MSTARLVTVCPVTVDGRILFIDRAVAADGHGEEVPARLLELGMPRRH